MRCWVFHVLARRQQRGAVSGKKAGRGRCHLPGRCISALYDIIKRLQSSQQTETDELGVHCQAGDTRLEKKNFLPNVSRFSLYILTSGWRGRKCISCPVRLTRSMIAIHGSVEIRAHGKYIYCRSCRISPAFCSLQVCLADSAQRLDFIVQTATKQKKYLQAHLIFLFSPVRKNKTKTSLYFDRI